ncbi:DUF4278 domain-containing protein [Scytonema hofmannii]|uniref:DUF4278 domain-containing protein n=1 Tax=Scytonema hofmannii TaxID=34078 RepID=UPI0009D75655
MQLSYRGSQYNTSHTQFPNPPYFVNTKYRGISYSILRITTVPTQTKSELKYRGVTYLNLPHPKSEVSKLLHPLNLSHQ